MWRVFSDVPGRILGHNHWEPLAGIAFGAIVGLGCARCIFCFWGKRIHLGPKKVVVLTGCDSGLGYSLAVHCVNLGSTVVAGLLQADGPAAQDLLKRGVMVLPLDITNEDSMDNFDYSLQRLLEDDQLELHALVNNAGVMVFGEFEWQLPEQARLQLEVNLLGTMSITRRLMPLLRRQVGSRIVTVTSHCALAPLPGLSVYGASKAALQAWSTSLRVEVAKYGVDVVMFIPGGFVNESNLMARQRQRLDEMRAGMAKEARWFYGEYFERYADYLQALSGDRALQPLANPRVYQAFDGALLDARPRPIYKCESWRYAIYHFLFRILPSRTRDWLVERFVRMPAWRGPGGGVRGGGGSESAADRAVKPAATCPTGSFAEKPRRTLSTA